MNRATLRKLAFGIVAVSCVTVFAGQLSAIVDLEAFEWDPLYELLGPQGLAMLTALNVGLVLLLHRSIAGFLGRSIRYPRVGNVVIASWAVLVLWTVDWMFLETPLSLRITRHLMAQHSITLPDAAALDFASFSITDSVVDPKARKRLETMYERIRLVNPVVTDVHPIGTTIDRYAKRFDVDPAILFHLAYVHSFWGEAASGRVPFLRAMTSETIRDVVQIHLPSWFIESRLRQILVASGLLQRLAGDHLGFKLRYALHKATLDVSAQPFELNMFSDVLLVLREYPQEFDDLLGMDVRDPVKSALRDAYLRVGEITLLRPYERPYAVSSYDSLFYSQHRSDLKRFARAAYYATALDFDLATRIAALLVDYQRNYYIAALGPYAWSTLPAYQSAAMLVMTRDVFVPSVGKLGYNLYALPEMNCMPVAFVADQARKEHAIASGRVTALWRPRDYFLLWGGAGTKLRVFSEVWSAIYGLPLPGLDPVDTVATSRDIVLLQQAP